MDFQPITYPVDKIVSLLRAGRLALPDFQREFVWSPHKVVELLDSVSRGWPVGSLLLLRGPQPFRARQIDSAPSLHDEVDLFVLDGQQRITALFHAIADVSDTAYYVDFEALNDGSPDYIVWKRRSTAEKELGTPASRAARGFALIKEVVDNQLFYEWQSSLSPNRAHTALQLRETQLAGLRSKVYRLPVVELEHEIELEALARIFETINRTGVRLNAFDLMVAVLYPHHFNLRDSWDDARVTFRNLREFDVDGIEILKLIALWARRRQQQSRLKVTVRGVRQGDVLAVPPKDVKENWLRSINAYDSAISIARYELGVVNVSIAPPQAMLLAMAAFSDEQGETSVATGELKTWYWSNIVLQGYSQGANTRVVSDVDRVAKDVRSTLPPEIASVLSPAIFEPIRRNKILVNGIAGALVLSGAMDIVDGQPLSRVENEPIAARSVTAILQGDARPNEGALVSDMVFAKESCFARLSSELRRGSRPESALSEQGLRSQFADVFEREERARAIRVLLESLVYSAKGES